MRAVALGSLLLLPVGLLTACGDKADAIRAGDVIQAREDDQFKDGREVTVVLPTGRLLIHSSDPVGTATSDQTRIREAVDAPSGDVLVPITWQYDTWGASDRLEEVVDTTDTPIVDLVTGDEHYRLPPPERGSKRGESFYVVVGGDAEDRTLKIDFDGVTQTVDLKTGTRHKGRAAALYKIDDERLKKKSCDEGWFDSQTVNAEFTCAITGPVLTPYAAGEWAPEGSLWLALTLTTEIGVYGETDLMGSGARYSARSVTMTTTIDGKKPAVRRSTGTVVDHCPIAKTLRCGVSDNLVYEVPADDGEQGPLAVELSYRIRQLNKWGTWDKPAHRRVDEKQKLKLWED